MATGRIPTTANSPLTAKGDLFTFSTGSAKLAVGNNGETLVADSSTSTGLAYREDYAAGKNKIINGDFRFNQRAFTSTTTDGAYGFDRFKLVAGSGATMSAQTFTPGTAPVSGYEAANFCRIVTTGQSGAAVYSMLEQDIEDVRTFAGQTITLSFWAKAATGTPKIATQIFQQFGAGGSPSAVVETYVGQSTLSTSWARYSVSIAVPSISGKTIGTTANSSYLGIRFWVSAGTDNNAQTGSLGIQSNTFDMWGVQVEDGSVATAFNTATGTIQGELAACQRYYQEYGSDGFNYTTTAAASGGNINATVYFPVKMRTGPSASHNLTNANYSSAWGLDVAYVAGNVAKTGTVTVNTATTINTCIISPTGATWASTPNVLAILAGVGYLKLSAEL